MGVAGVLPALRKGSSWCEREFIQGKADQQFEQMQNKSKPSELIERLADFLKKAEKGTIDNLEPK